MILDGLGIDDLFTSGKARSFAFLLDMNRLFEQFLYRYLHSILEKSVFSISYQYRDRSIIWDLFHNRPYSQVIPDFIVSTENPIRQMAIDAKYKLYDNRKVASGDIAQVFLYAYAYQVSPQPTAILIYPTEGNSTQSSSMLIRQREHLNAAKIHVLGLHLPQVLKEIKLPNQGETAKLIMQLISHNLIQDTIGDAV